MLCAVPHCEICVRLDWLSLKAIVFPLYPPLRILLHIRALDHIRLVLDTAILAYYRTGLQLPDCKPNEAFERCKR